MALLISVGMVHWPIDGCHFPGATAKQKSCQANTIMERYMTQDSNSQIEPTDILKLKIAEPEVSKEDPWADDALGRKKLGDRLTNLVRDQSAPFTVTIHGTWGTGKTFLLRRCQRDLENNNFRANYFTHGKMISVTTH